MKKSLFYLFIILGFFQSIASHIKAGEILLKKNQNNSLNYTFDFVLYYDATNISIDKDPGGGLISVYSIGINVGDGSPTKEVLLRKIEYFTDKKVAKATYTTSHTYSGSGRYMVSFSESWRIDGILNMKNSGTTDLFIEALVIINPFAGVNSSPILTFPPLDDANKNKIYTHNPGAYDPDGDSLVFELVTPKGNFGKVVEEYTDPADPKFGGQSTQGNNASFVIDKRSGQITWNTPGKPGYYNVAIKVSEYRKGTLLGYIIRDMQIEVKESLNNPPDVAALDSVCIMALKANLIDYKVSDPDKKDLIVVIDTGFGSAFQSVDKPLFLNLKNPVSNPYIGRISWTPSCDLVREQPYQILIKAEDNVAPDLRLSDIFTINAKVRGPKPSITKAVITPNKQVRLSLAKYSNTCRGSNIKLRIYRSECEPSLTFDPCQIHKYISPNYVQIGEISSTDTAFVDTNNGLPFKSAVKYYYTAIAFFPDPAKGVSYASEVQEVVFLNKNILINTVSVINNQTISLTWTNPDLDGTNPVYGFEILRSTDSINFTSIYKETGLAGLSQTKYNDAQVNTLANKYYYKIGYFHDGDTSTVIWSAIASPLFLSYVPKSGAALLRWKGAIPNTIEKIKIFDVRQNKYIDSVTYGSTYLIQNLKACDTTEYYVTSEQRYCITNTDTSYTADSYRIKLSPLANTNLKFSLSLLPNYCTQSPCDMEVPLPTADTLTWRDLRSAICGEIEGYRVYFKSILNNEYQLVGTTQDTSFISFNSVTRVGCYKVALLIKDDKGQIKESTTSNELCILNDCFCYQLPNVITPNHDNLNDKLVPLRFPRFYKNIKITIYNRWGSKVFESEGPTVNWDASNNDSGVYFYECEVSKYSLNGQDKELLKGTVTVLK